MKQELDIIFSEKTEGHHPPPGFFNGVPRDSYDQSGRVYAIIDALRELNLTNRVRLFNPRDFDENLLHLVHDPEYVAFLKALSSEMAQKPDIPVAKIIDVSTSQVEIAVYPAFTYPSVFPHGVEPKYRNIEAQKGVFVFDIATPISGNTFNQALLSARIALTGADMLFKQSQLVYSLCRPPGHHAERGRMGSYCYFNNAAIAAEYLKQNTNGRIAVLDIDAHHGNGSQDIFYEDPYVYYASVHGDPEKKHPYLSGYSEEIGSGAGVGTNLNIPLPIGSDGCKVIQAIEILIYRIKQFRPDYLVVSVGFDGLKDDPSKVFAMDCEAYAHIGALINAMDLPTLSIQEGGYYIPKLARNVTAFLRGLMKASL